jgi:hypothetical protein
MYIRSLQRHTDEQWTRKGKLRWVDVTDSSPGCLSIIMMTDDVYQASLPLVTADCQSLGTGQEV